MVNVDDLAAEATQCMSFVLVDWIADAHRVVMAWIVSRWVIERMLPRPCHTGSPIFETRYRVWCKLDMSYKVERLRYHASPPRFRSREV
jgi:hypothetical protein